MPANWLAYVQVGDAYPSSVPVSATAHVGRLDSSQQRLIVNDHRLHAHHPCALLRQCPSLCEVCVLPLSHVASKTSGQKTFTIICRIVNG